MTRFVKRIIAALIAVLLLCSYGFSCAVPSAMRSTVSSEKKYTLLQGVTESSVTLNGGKAGVMLQIAPTAKAKWKVSYSNYFTEGSSKATRTSALSKFKYSLTRPTVQAAAYEKATSRNVIFAMNGNFAFDSGEPMGLIKVEGNVLHPSESTGSCYFAILKDGSYAFRTYTEDHSDVVEAVAGRQWLVRNGKQAKQNNEVLSARTAIGQKADGTLVAFVANGKTNSYGVTINDMAELMFSLGCVNAINLDGGGSSLFATQRAGSDDLVIRNAPSDSTGERAVSSTLFLVTEPESDHLYFDFTNDAEAKRRYDADVYGGTNFDVGNWHYNHTCSTVPLFDNTAGTLSFSSTPEYTAGRHIHPIITSLNTSYTGGHPLVYVPTGNDYFKVRMKIEGSTDTEANFRLMYGTDDGEESTAVAYSCVLPAGFSSGEYFTLEGKLNFNEVDAVTAIRPEIYNLTIAEPSKTTVKFTYDYIYVGPRDKSATPDHLLFDFTDDATAQKRYETITYGFMNFNKGSNAYWATAYNGASSSFSIANGALNVDVTDGYSGTAEAGNLTYGPWIKTTNSYGKFTGRTTYSLFPFSFYPQECQVLQMGFKVENCIVPSGKTPTLVLEYYYTKDDVHEHKNDIRKTFGINNGEYQILTVPVSAAFTQADVIKCIGFRFQNLKGDAKGNIAIDYIYIGPACTAPEGGHAWDQGTLTTSPSCTTEGVRTYTCGSCDAIKTERIKATGHSYNHSKVDERVHLTTCNNCDLVEERVHSYTNGNCICGASEIKEPVLLEGLKLGHTLNLASDISVIFAVSKSYMEGFEMGSVYVLTEVDVYEGNTKTGTKVFEILPEEQGNYYYFTLTGMTAVNMNDTIRSVLYGMKDGQLYYSNTDEYSIATYAYSQMDKAAAKDSLKILCADLLRYGAKAQIFKSYRTDALADGAMTESQKAYLSPMEDVTFNTHNVVLDDLGNDSVTWVGKSLDLASKVTLKLIFDPANYSGNMEDLVLHLSYEGMDGSVKTSVLEGPELYNASYGFYTFAIDSLLAAELRTVISAQIFAGEAPVSRTLQYSADTYGNNKTGDLLTLCKALFAYSDSAVAFFQS